MRLVNPVRFKLNRATFLAAADVAVTQGIYTEIGRYKGQVGEALDMGFGAYDKLNEAVGRILAELKDTAGADLEGLIRIERHDAQDNFIDKVYEDRTETLRAGGGATPVLSEQTPFSQMKMAIGRDSYFVIYIKPDAANKTLDVSASTVMVDCTRFKALYNY